MKRLNPERKSILRKGFFFFVRITCIPLLLYHFKQRNRITVIYYHAPSAKSFRRQIGYLKKRYTIVPLSTIAGHNSTCPNDKLPRYPLVITFDDGHASNYALAPVFRDLNIPATIFITAGICGTDEPFWFLSRRFTEKEKKMLKEVSDEQRLKYLDETNRDNTVKKRQALSWQEISEMKSVVDFQSHTLTHPCLPNCSDEIADNEITRSKELIEKKTGSKVFALCYPNGDYSDREINFARESGYTLGFTGKHGFILPGDDPFSLKRISMNDTNDFNEFIVRVSGLWGLFKRIKRI